MSVVLQERSCVPPYLILLHTCLASASLAQHRAQCSSRPIIFIPALVFLPITLLTRSFPPLFTCNSSRLLVQLVFKSSRQFSRVVCCINPVRLTVPEFYCGFLFFVLNHLKWVMDILTKCHDNLSIRCKVSFSRWSDSQGQVITRVIRVFLLKTVTV